MTGTLLNADINGLATFIIDIAAILFLVSAFAIISISIAAGLSGLFRLGGRGDGIGQEGRRSLHMGNRAGDGILGDGVGHNGRRNGRNLHQSPFTTALRRMAKIWGSTLSLNTLAYIIAYTE